MARTCALDYDGWSGYRRAAHPKARMEAITSRPLLLAAIGTVANHDGQTTLQLTPLHGKTNILKQLIANISEASRHVRAAAKQFTDIDRWGCLLRYVSDEMASVTASRLLPTLPGKLRDSGSQPTAFFWRVSSGGSRQA